MTPRRRLGTWVRRSRSLPVVGRLVRAADRVWWWRTIHREDVVDPAYYAAQLGLRGIPPVCAVWHYVIAGFRRGYSLNPLLDEVHAGGHLPEVFRVPAMYAYLRSDRAAARIHPLWDAPAHAVLLEPSPRGALERVWRDGGAVLRLRMPGLAIRETSVEDFRRLAIAAARKWRSATPAAPRIDPADDRLLRFIQKRDRRYALKIEQTARMTGTRRAGVVALVDPAPSQWVSASLATTVATDMQLRRYRRSVRWGSVVAASAEGAVAGTLVVLDPRAEFSDDEVERLFSRAGCGDAVAPAHREENGTCAGVGAAAIDRSRRPYRILRDHPHEDVARLAPEVAVPRLCGHSFAAPAAALGGGSALAQVRRAFELDDLAVRTFPLIGDAVVLTEMSAVLEEPELVFATRRPGARIEALDRTGRERAEEILSDAHFAVVDWRSGPGRTVSPRVEWRRPSPGSRRWAIKICSPAGRRGEVWGDTHFAYGLAAALRRRGHEVVVDTFGSARRSTAYVDDVSVTIRGPYRIDPPDTGINLQWIISHPDEITRRELTRFSWVFAASEPWAEKVSRRWGVPVEPLLECVDTDRFVPRGLPRGDDIVFVGTARGIARPAVVAPIRAGVDVKVYGPDWLPFIPAAAVVAPSIPNDELPARYETAAIVLNDQWPAMRREGFIAMRPFDAVAVGARVISEEVAGISELFYGAVRTFRDEDELISLLARDPAEVFPDDDTMATIARRIRREHSFDARAAVLDEASRRTVPSDGGG